VLQSWRQKRQGDKPVPTVGLLQAKLPSGCTSHLPTGQIKGIQGSSSQVCRTALPHSPLLGVVLLCPNRTWLASTTHLQLVSVRRVPANKPLGKASSDPCVICESARPTRVSMVEGRGGLSHCILAVS
jgi:hypothetical protein